MIDQLQQTLNQTSDIVGGVSPDQYDASTPCPEYDVRTLMNHMVAGNLMFAGVANGRTNDFPDLDFMMIVAPSGVDVKE